VDGRRRSGWRRSSGNRRRRSRRSSSRAPPTSSTSAFTRSLGRAPERWRRTGPGRVPTARRAGRLRQGLLSNLLNPKVAVFFTSLLPQSSPGAAVLPSFLLLGALFDALGVVWLVLYPLATSRGRAALQRPAGEGGTRRGLRDRPGRARCPARGRATGVATDREGQGRPGSRRASTPPVLALRAALRSPLRAPCPRATPRRPGRSPSGRS
jgi:hypothetical protein